MERDENFRVTIEIVGLETGKKQSTTYCTDATSFADTLVKDGDKDETYTNECVTIDDIRENIEGLAEYLGTNTPSARTKGDNNMPEQLLTRERKEELLAMWKEQFKYDIHGPVELNARFVAGYEPIDDDWDVTKCLPPNTWDEDYHFPLTGAEYDDGSTVACTVDDIDEKLLRYVISDYLNMENWSDCGDWLASPEIFDSYLEGPRILVDCRRWFNELTGK